MLANEGFQGQAGGGLDALGVGRWEWSLELPQLACDDVTARILGVERSRWVTRKQWFELVHPGDQTRLREATAAARRAAPGTAVDIVYRIVRADGERQLFSRGVVRAGEAHGTTLAGFVIDITEVHSPPWRAAETLAGSLDAVSAIDSEWRISYLDPLALEIAGRPAEDLVGRVLWDEFPMDAEHESLLRRAASEGEPTSFEVEYPGLGWMFVRAFPTREGGLTIQFRNIDAERAMLAERTRLLEAERQAREDAEAAQRQLRHAADHDALTNLPNRSAVLGWLRQEVEGAGSRGGVAALFVDLDRFRVVNESLGHGCGDTLIAEVAARLAALVGSAGIVARIGGDEFLVARRCRDADEATQLAGRVLNIVREPLVVSNRRLVITASVGVAWADGSTTAEAVLRDAELALYRAKDGGRDRLVLFDAPLRDAALERLALEQDLRLALEQDELTLAYQPNFDLRTGLPTGAEALARWPHPERGPVAPSNFIPVAEATGLIVPLGAWALRTVATRLRNAVLPPEVLPHTIWVNVSGRQLAEPGFAEEVAGLVEGVADRMGIEITESLLLEAGSGMHDVLRRLSALGLRIAIDDFGTGYSGLAQLGRYPVDVVKIDRSFITQLDHPEMRAIVSAIIDVARAVGAATVAEGVETEDELATLRALGCDEVCGYLLARPGPPEQLESNMRAGLRVIRASQPKPLPLSWPAL